MISNEAALNSLLHAMTTEPLTKNVREQLPAIISHWLHTPEKDPLILDRRISEVWRNILSGNIMCSDVPFPPVKSPHFTFIDVFAGIGGFRIALQSLGGKCVFSSELDRHAQRTYQKNFGEMPFGDIRSFTGKDVSDEQLSKWIPDHDILVAGFPCQPFSKAGVSARKSLDRKHGFACETQGTLFFDLMRIVKAKRPRVVFLENVKHLVGHDKGRTFKKIEETITQELGYSFSMSVLDSSTLVAQRRLRCYMVCFRDPKEIFSFPCFTGKSKTLGSILLEVTDPRYTISSRLWEGHQRRTERNRKRGAGFAAILADPNKPTNTLVARYYKDGKECLVNQPGRNPRKLIPKEFAILQGFPDEFIPSNSDMQAYRQFGNAVTVPVIKEIAKNILELLTKRCE